jgi:hypothetical protein
MKYIKRFENIINTNLNSILLIDCSAFFQPDLKKVLNSVNLYLTDRFYAIFCTPGNLIYEFMNLQELKFKIDNYHLYDIGVDDVQGGLNTIKYNKIDGNILILSDGYIKLDLSGIKNNVAILSSDAKPTLLNDDNCKIFYNDLESLDQFYLPRDESYEKYELKKSAKKYNL